MDGRPNSRNKTVFSRWISVDGRSSRRNKTVFSNSSSVVWTEADVYPRLPPIMILFSIFCSILIVGFNGEHNHANVY